MRPKIAYDISNYAVRLFTATPTGIGRVDVAYGHHLAHRPGMLSVGLRLGLTGPRLHSPERVRSHLDAVLARWSERDQTPDDPDLAGVRNWLLGRSGDSRRLVSRAPAANHVGASANSVRIWGLNNGRLSIPKGAIYLNVAFSSLHKPHLYTWLDARPDIKPVFVVHDLLPIDYPEYFWPGHFSRFEAALATIVHRAAAVVVSSAAVRDRFAQYAARTGRTDIRIHVAPFAPDPQFLASPAPDEELRRVPYFVMCSTIEPRKNHLTLLQIWRSFAQRGGPVPKLVIIGKRGWENEQVIDFFERCAGLTGHVLEVSDLTSPALAHLVANARAVLMPSFAEGFGLPLVEALSLGTPVVASDIPVFREVTQGRGSFVHPLDGLGWLRRIDRLAFDDAHHRVMRTRAARFVPARWDSYFSDLEAFLADL